MNSPTPAQENDDDRSADMAILETLRGRRYVAFQSLPGRVRIRPRLFLVPRQGLWQWLDNGALWRMRARPDGKQIWLSFHSAAVVIEGTGLMMAAFAIDRHTCLFLQEHDPERHDAPQSGEAVIRSIKFYERVPDRLAPEGHPDAVH